VSVRISALVISKRAWKWGTLVNALVAPTFRFWGWILFCRLCFQDNNENVFNVQVWKPETGNWLNCVLIFVFQTFEKYEKIYVSDWMFWESDHCFHFLFVRCWVQIFIYWQPVLTEVYFVFHAPSSKCEDITSDLVTTARLSFLVHYSQYSYHLMLCILRCWEYHSVHHK
jgi:hypothetical protein